MEPLANFETKKVSRRQWVTIGVLCFVNLINYMDRFTIAGILEDIQVDFQIDNSKAGLLQTAFVVSYMIFAPLFGYLGDRYSRKLIMAGGVLLWSLTTLLGSYMTDFHWFLAFRGMVGIGEASYSTIAPTIISDMFVDDLRSKMLALFYFAIPVGSGLGYIVGSVTAKAAGQWQWALRVTPVLGILAVFLVYFVIMDPPRGEVEGSNLETTSWVEDIKYLVKNRSFMLSTFGFTCVSFVAGALAFWGPKFIHTGIATQPGDNKLDKDKVSLIFGIIAMASGLLGVPLGSFIAQKLRTYNYKADPLVCAFGLLVSTPLLFMASIMAQYSTVGCFTLIFFGEFFLNLNWAIVADILLYVIIPTRRSTAEAFQILLSHALGDAGSPYLIGQVSEWIKAGLKSGNEEVMGSYVNTTTVSSISHHISGSQDQLNEFRSLQYSLFITSFVEVLGGLFFLMTAWYILSDKAKTDKAISVTTPADAGQDIMTMKVPSQTEPGPRPAVQSTRL